MTPAISIISLCVVMCLSTMVTGPGSARDDRQAAVAAWEQAVAAKGGRDRLAALRGFAIKEHATFDKPTRPDMAVAHTEQIVVELPDRWWSFSDYRPGKMGYSVRAVNLRTGERWATYDGQPAKTNSVLPDRVTGERLQQLQYVYFLETRWVRPAPARVTRAQHGGRAVDRIETAVDGQTVVFDLAADTHLPVRIETVVRTTVPPVRPDVNDGKPIAAERRFVYELDGYHDVGGIQVPARVTLGGDPANVDVEINPEINAAIFTGPPPHDAGLDSWRGGASAR
jgi:hypothetical protein